MPQPKPLDDATKSAGAPVAPKEYVALANYIQGKDRVHKKDPHAEAVRSAGRSYEQREYVAAYECFRPAYEKVVADMQRVLARNVESEATKIAQAQRKPLATAKENVLAMRAHAQQVIDQFDRLRRDLETKPLVRAHLRKPAEARAAAPLPPVDEAAPTVISSTGETQVDVPASAPDELEIGGQRFTKRPYSRPAVGTLYAVRDKSKAERVIRVSGVSADGAQVHVEVLEGGLSLRPPVQLAVESLARQAARGWCKVLLPVRDERAAPVVERPDAEDADAADRGTLRIDIQNFGRCCAGIAQAGINFSTQLVKDVGDGPFRAGKYEHAFLTFEQLAVGFTAAVAAGRREIEDGRRKLADEKGNLSGREIQERTAAFIRREQRIHAVEREFSTILEGLRMFLRAGEVGTAGE